MTYLIQLLFYSFAICTALLIVQPHAYASEEFFLKPLQNVSLETDFTALFSDSSPELKELVLPGTFRFELGGDQWTYKVEVSVRGNTSKYDCSFKKLALKVDKKSKGPLEGTSKLRINTHCSDNMQGYTEMGRVAGPAGPVREGAVYDWMRVLGLSTFLSTVTPITYKDLSNKQTTQSFALILESKKDLGLRLGGKALEEEDLEDQEAFLDRASVIAKSNVTLKGLLFNALVGNADFSLQLKDLEGERHYNPITPPSGMWNMLALVYANTINIVPTDFDVSGVVVQKQVSSDPIIKRISGCLTGLCEFQFSHLQKWRSFFSPSLFATASREMESKIAELKEVVAQNKYLNPVEKKYFSESVDSFVDVLRMHNNVPVITNSTRVFLDAEMQIICGMENVEDGYVITAPAGLPVKLLATHSKSIKVLLLDTRDGVLINPGGGSCDGEVFLPKETSITADWPN